MQSKASTVAENCAGRDAALTVMTSLGSFTDCMTCNVDEQFGGVGQGPPEPLPLPWGASVVGVLVLRAIVVGE